MFDKYITSLEAVTLSSKDVNNKISLMESLKKFMTAVFFLYRTFSYRYFVDSEGGEEKSLLDLKRSYMSSKSATDYFYRLTALYPLYLMKSNLLAEDNGVIKKKNEQYKQYAFELCLAVFSICDWINEGNVDYNEWSSNYKAPAILTMYKVFGAIVDENTPSKVFKRFDKAIQELDSFDKSNMLQYINNNVSLVANNKGLYPKGSLLWTDSFGYVNLKRIKPNLGLPLSMACGYNKSRREYCPNFLFLYDSQQLLRTKQSLN